MRTNAPSFNSFPERAPQPPPPTFSSFPELTPVASTSRAHSSSTRRERSPSPKRHRSSRPSQPADKFLNALGDELGMSRREGEERERGERSDRRGKASERREADRERDKHRRPSDHSERSHRSRDHSRSHQSGDDGHRSSRRDSDRDASDEERRKRRRGRDRDEGQLGREKSKRVHSDYGSKSYQLVQVDSHSTPPPRRSPPPPPTERTYFISLKGDDDLIKYAALPKSNVPRYRRFGAGHVLGLPPGWKITLETAWTGRGIVVAPPNYVPAVRYADPKVVQAAKGAKYKRITGASRSDGLRVVRRADVKRPEDPFLPRAKDPSRFVPLEPDESDEDDEDARQRDTEETLRQRNVEFDQKLRQHPGDVELWVRFAAFQDELAQKTFAGSAPREIQRSAAEVKLSILERALQVSQNAGSQDLLVAYHEVGSVVWEPRRARKKWRAAMKEHPGLGELVRAYERWKETMIEEDFI